MPMFPVQEKKNLAKLLSYAVKRDEALSLDGLHGFLYGLAIIPEPVVPREWLPGIFGEEMVEFQSKEEGDRLLGSLFTAYNRMTQQNEDEELVFPFDIGKLKRNDIQRIRKWTHGFFLATSLRPDIWGKDDEEDEDFEPEPAEDEEYDDDDAEIAACYAIVMGVVFPERIPEIFDHDEDKVIPLDKKDPDLEANLFVMLPKAVETLQEYANAVRDGMRELRADNYSQPPQPRRVVKVGRNDPCPCGSGSNYKEVLR